MNADQFISKNRDKWDRLTHLVSRSSGSGIRHMQPSELRELGELYRTVTSDFALAQRDYAGQPVVSYLNQLVAQTHAAIYRGRPSQAVNLLDFLFVTFPRTFRHLSPFILVAFLMLVVPALASGVLVYLNPNLAEWTFDESDKELIPIVKQGKLWIDLPEQDRPATSAFIMTNNIRVSLTALAGGASASIVTIYILVTNGLSIGGLMGLCFHYGLGWRLVNFVIGHGVNEFTVIFMTAGAGLRMGWAILHPGAQSRKDSLILATREAIVLAAGCIPLLIIAGLIEGFVSPQFNPLYSVIAGAASGLCTYGWLLLGGRNLLKAQIATGWTKGAISNPHS
jgi:uncharacterized membrane protein SpoIIM required for sporulation